jgi:hypothetical protein
VTVEEVVQDISLLDTYEKWEIIPYCNFPLKIKEKVNVLCF